MNNNHETVNYPEIIAKAADDRKAQDIVILDMRGVTLIADYFIICHGNSTTQTRAIADSVEEKMREQGIRVLRREGVSEGTWILLDYGHYVVHIFTEQDRSFYGLERLWGDAKRIEFQLTV
jgi:ribosome-associated protein